MLIKAAIIDDEQFCIDSLMQKLNKFQQKVIVVNTFTDPRKGIESLIKAIPDVLFLDINLGTMTGFDLIENLPSPLPKIIFTTAYDHHAVRAFKYNALDYLLKPIDEDDLGRAISKLDEPENAWPGIQQIQQAVQDLNTKVSDIQKIALPTINGFELIELKNLVRLEANSNYTHFILSDGKKIIISKTIKEYEDLLDPEGFVRIHQSHIINMRYLKSFIKGKSATVVMHDGSELDVGATRKEYFLEKFKTNFRLS
jgi:two-component system LytT family response regulator